MASQSFDLAVETKETRDHYEKIINDIGEEYLSDLSDLYENLIKYRKSLINSNCTAYGGNYKKIKIQLTELTNSRLEVLNSIYADIKTYKNYILKLKQSIVDNLNVYESNSTNCFESIKAITISYHKELNRFKHENNKRYDELTNKLSKETKEKISTLMRENKNEIKSLQTEIKRILSTEIQKRFSKFQQIKISIKQLKESYKSARLQYTNIVNDHKKYFLSAMQIRTKIVSDTKSSTKHLKSKNYEIKRKISLENERFQEQKIQNEKKLNENRRNYNNQLASTQMEINNIKIKSQEENKKKCFGLQESHQKIQKQFDEIAQMRKSEIQKKNGAFIGIRHDLKSKLHALKRIYRVIHAGNLALVASTKDFSEKFSIDLQKDEENMKIRHQEEIKNIEIFMVTNRISDSLQRILNDTSQQKEILNHTIAKYKSEVINYDSTFDKLSKERESQLTNILFEKEKYYDELLLNKQKECCIAIKKKKMENEDHSNLIINKFKADLDTKIETLPKFKVKPPEQFSFDIEEQYHKKELEKLRDKLDLISKQIDQVTNERQILKVTLDSELLSFEKRKRKEERAAISGKAEVNEEYERLIQIEEVKLKSHIDQMSKIFGPDVHLMALEVNAALRKVHQAKQLSNDLIIKEKRKLEELKKMYSIERAKINFEISQIQTGKKQKELEFHILKREKEAESKYNTFEKETHEIINKMNKQIEDEKMQIQKQKEEIQNKIKNDEIAFQKTVKEIQRQRAMIKSKDTIIQVSELSVEKLKRLHATDILYTESRIDEAKAQQKKIISEFRSELEIQTTKYMQELESRLLVLDENYSRFRDQTNNEIKDFIKEMLDKAMTHEGLIIQTITNPQNYGIAENENKMKFSLQLIQREIVSEFQNLYNVLRCKFNAHVIEPPPENIPRQKSRRSVRK